MPFYFFEASLSSRISTCDLRYIRACPSVGRKKEKLLANPILSRLSSRCSPVLPSIFSNLSTWLSEDLRRCSFHLLSCFERDAVSRRLSSLKPNALSTAAVARRMAEGSIFLRWRVGAEQMEDESRIPFLVLPPAFCPPRSCSRVSPSHG